MSYGSVGKVEFHKTPKSLHRRYFISQRSNGALMMTSIQDCDPVWIIYEMFISIYEAILDFKDNVF